MTHVAFGKIAIKSGVADVIGTSVRFTDGIVTDVDTIPAGTGHELELPFPHHPEQPYRPRSTPS